MTFFIPIGPMWKKSASTALIFAEARINLYSGGLASYLICRESTLTPLPFETSRPVTIAMNVPNERLFAFREIVCKRFPSFACFPRCFPRFVEFYRGFPFTRSPPPGDFKRTTGSGTNEQKLILSGISRTLELFVCRTYTWK